MEEGPFDNLLEIRRRKSALENAIALSRSMPWQLRLWSRLVRCRDGHRCLCCEATNGIQAHHIIRRTLLPYGALEAGNGITLCTDCHRQIHAQFNRRPNRNLPIGAEQGDDQDEWSYLFGLLVDDANSRSLSQNEFYHLSDAVLDFSVSCQGYDDLLATVRHGEMSRLRFMHEIWRIMPQTFYENLLSNLLRSDLDG